MKLLPQWDHKLSDAERQARYRARRQAQQPAPIVRYRRPADRRTLPQRWRDAVAELLTLQAEYTAWLEALPDSLQDTDTALSASTSDSSFRNAGLSIEPPENPPSS